MPRNGSDGTYTLADSVAPATLADANELMTIFNDLGSALTASIAKDGQTPITAQLKGLVSSNPVYSFDGDSNTGLGSDAADELFFKCGGTKIAKVSAAGLDVLSGSLLVSGAKLAPTGIATDYIGVAAPAGWILGEGRSIGDGSSGATERANADTEALFTLIYNTANTSNGEGQLQDSSGSNVARGASAAADFAAHRRILVANYKNRTSRGTDPGVTAPGATVGADSATLAQSALPNVTLGVSASGTPAISGVQALAVPAGQGSIGINGGTLASVYTTGNFFPMSTLSVTGATASINGGVAQTSVATIPNAIVKTKIIKL